MALRFNELEQGMLWVGLTGGIASGKSTVSALLKKAGIPVVDADELAKSAVQPGTQVHRQILSHFGTQIRGPGDELDRKKLGALVFADPVRLRWLESLVHPIVQDEVRRLRSELQDQGHAFAIYDVPLLFEKKLQDQFDRIIVVDADEETRIQRLATRNGFNREEALLRIRNQVGMDEKRKGASDVIQNDGDLHQLEESVQNLIQKLKALSSKA